MTTRTGTYFTPENFNISTGFESAYFPDYRDGYILGYSTGFTTGLGTNYKRRVHYDDGYDAGRSRGFMVGVITGQSIPNPAGTYQDGYEAGFNRGFMRGDSMDRKRRTHYDDGYEAGKARGRMQGLAVGVGLAPATSTTPPTITISSVPTTPEDPIVVHVYDNVGLRFYHITCQDRTDGSRYTVWDPHDQFFSFPFDNVRSTVTGTGVSTDPYIFTVYRLGGWPTGISLDIRVRAIDNVGNESEG